MNKKTVIAAVAAAALIGGGIYYWQHHTAENPAELVLNGNVDIRQVSLSFDGSGRIRELLVNEGDKVTAGQVVGHLDTEALELQKADAEAQIQAQQANFERLKNGSRRQEITQGQSRLKAAEAQVVQAKGDLARLQAIAADTDGKATSVHELDAAKSALKVAQAQADESCDALRLLEEGLRKEDIAAAAAQVKALKAKKDLLDYQIGQGELKAPVDAVVRSRLLEPGDMASPQTPVYTLALSSPKWVRVYVSETDLDKVREGMNADVTTDSAPDKPVKGTVGYISSVAEFTPKAVQTTELRSSLVYEVRVNVDDKANALRMGQPATVKLHTAVAAH
ncbi:HlyD family efflux transporter periplasmic adaptor subunit [Neisseria perflava]|uniref:HlyD family efflux transporter periplasmic adaptor subunit n=1 Tax=Neisseria perflava TaxID=33053 RepID=UPI00209D4F7E|nr:HlyD family efflux transporter periplasmic adaptor subunit [Neisseria perflava]MCP1659403.1 HlyD family secretion protein [Neisseria perflava]